MASRDVRPNDLHGMRWSAEEAKSINAPGGQIGLRDAAPK
jgi:hypothetical protein